MAFKTVAPGRSLEKAAAASYQRARRDGLPAGITSALREHAEQRKLFLERYRPQATGSGPYGDVRRYQGRRYVRTSSAGSVAIPGSEWSRHERGLSLDLPEPARAWMRAHGHRYGWIRDVVPGEPWHFEYQAARDTRPAPAVATKPTPAPTTAPPARTQEDTTMHIIRKGISSATYVYRLVTGGRAVEISQAAAKALAADGIKITALPNVDFDRIAKELR